MKELGFVFVAGFLLKFFMDEFKKHGEERKIWAQLFQENIKAVIEHNQRACDFQTRVSDEHKKMTDILSEITITLGRINGYKHD